MASRNGTSPSLRHQHPKEYRCWEAVKQRCFNPRCHAFPDYGGRGITMDNRWRLSFDAFLLAVGTAPSPFHSLDRIDNDGHYESGNVRWATASEQQKNKRRFSRQHLARRARVPKYCLHKPTGRGYARFEPPRPMYFPGPFGSPESLAAYQLALEFWARCRRAGREISSDAMVRPGLSRYCSQLIRAYARWYDRTTKEREITTLERSFLTEPAATGA